MYFNLEKVFQNCQRIFALSQRDTVHFTRPAILSQSHIPTTDDLFILINESPRHSLPESQQQKAHHIATITETNKVALHNPQRQLS